MRLIRVFDLDGTLVDSRDAVIASYKDVGIEMKPWHWGKPWRVWLEQACLDAGMPSGSAAKVHEAKGRRYTHHRERVRTLPPRRLLENSTSDVLLCIISGASFEAIMGYLISWGLSSHVRIVRGSLTLEQRIETLESIRDLTRNAEGGEIYDDDVNNCHEMRKKLDTDFWAIYHYVR